MILSGWGQYPRLECRLHRPGDAAQAHHALQQAGPAVIARGNGRAYGDSALQPLGTFDLRGMNRLLSFDPDSGQVVAEAGVLLADIISVFLPRGWFPIVTPGTRLVTLGGMIAADVHGKNHHRDGAFGSCLDWIELLDGTGQLRRCSETLEPALYQATLGGMGLTGVILRAAFRLRPVETGWIAQQTIATQNLQETLHHFKANADAPYTVAWLDCLAKGPQLGRAVLTLGDHASLGDLPAAQRENRYALPKGRNLSVPLHAPETLLNRLSLRAFNHLYHQRGLRAPRQALVPWTGFFYPLDGLRHWNRLYGKRGFLQYQCVLPPDSAEAGLQALLAQIAASGLGSPLAVLKPMGPEGPGQIGFPMPGYTLALDFPASPAAFSLLRHLDEVVIAHQGRFYLAKDSRLSAETLRRADPRIATFRAMREQHGLTRIFASSQSERLCL